MPVYLYSGRYPSDDATHFCAKLRNKPSPGRSFRTFGICVRTLCALVSGVHDELVHANYKVHMYDCTMSFVHSVWFRVLELGGGAATLEHAKSRQLLAAQKLSACQ